MNQNWKFLILLFALVACESKKDQFIIEEIDALKLELANDQFQKIKNKRLAALERNLLVKEEGDYVDGILHIGQEKVAVSVRLKGDHIDHLEGNRWSLRVKTKDKRLPEEKFSIQGVATRSYMQEWVFHELLKQEGVLHLNYQFLDFSINDTLKGVYAYESHFTNDLLDFNEVEKGPILKIDETEFWNFKNPAPYEGNRDVYLMKTSPINVYNDSWCEKDSARKDQMEKAIRLLDDFRKERLPFEEVFDQEKWAKYIAINELMQCKHALRWHNLRFYFNPNTELLEPIGFDCGTWFEPVEGLINYQDDGEPILMLMYQSTSFKKKVQEYLGAYAHKDFMRKFVRLYFEKIQELESLMKLEKATYRFWPSTYYQSQRRINDYISKQSKNDSFWEQ